MCPPVSPYLKSLSMVASNKLLHLLEAFCTPWFLFSAPHHHHLVFFLLETFNNIIQYQFDGNSNLVYTLIRKRQVFHSLANLPTDTATINRTLNSRRGANLMGKKWSSSSSKTGPGISVTKTVQNSLSSPSSENSTTNKDEGEEGRRKERDSVEPAVMEGSTPAQEAPPGTKTCTLAALPRKTFFRCIQQPIIVFSLLFRALYPHAIRVIALRNVKFAQMLSEFVARGTFLFW